MIRVITESEYYPDDYFMYDTFDTEKEGAYWYRTNHGVGLGGVPKGLYIYKTVEAPYGVTYFLTPHVLSANALKDYDIKEERPSEEFLAKYDTGKDNFKYKDDFKTWIKGAKALKRG